MNFKTTFVLLILVVVVGVTYIWKNHHDDANPTPEKVDEHKLVDIDSADITRVSITGSDDRHLVLEKAGSEWKMLQPSAARAKTFEVDDLVRAIVALKSRGQVDESKKTSGGLDHPSFIVELKAKNGKAAKLAFGDNSSVGDSLYVLVNDAAKPDIVGNGIYSTLDKPASTYRDMKLVTTASNEIKQIAITQKGKTIKLEKTGENWEVTEPAKIPAETSAVTDILSSITGLDATEFVDSPSAVATSSLAHPRMSVSFTTAAPTTQPAATQASELPGGQTIRFGGYKDVLKSNMYVSLGAKDVAVVPATSEKSFEKTPLDLRNRDVLNITPDRVSSFSVSINKPATTQPTTQPAEMREFAIERHKVAAPVLGPALPGGPAVPATAPSSPATQPTTPATQPASSTSDSSSPATQPAVATAQPAAATEPAPAATQAAAPATQPVDELATAKWIFTSGKTGAAEEGQVTDLLGSLHPLRAEKYVEPEKVTGATYTLKLHVIPASAGESATDETLTIIDTGGRVDGFYKDLQFTVDHSLIEKLTGDFKTKKAAPPQMPPSFGGGGSPFGG